jgi:LysM repeat protein
MKVYPECMKKITIVLLCLSFSFAAHSKNLIIPDSIGVEKVGNQSFIIHQVAEKETLFGISRRYQVAVNEILQNNPQLQEGLKMGQRIRVPFTPKSAIPAGARLHKVEPGETLFAVSKRYNVTVSEIMAWNKLQGNDLSVGQSLIIEGVAETPAEVATPAPQPAPAQPANSRVKETPAPKTAEVAPVKEKAKESVPPTKPVASQPESNANTAASLPGDWITHTVEQGETLFAISKKYNSKVEDIISWNALASNNLNPGQRLKVGRESSSANVPVVTASVPIIVNNERVNATLSTPRAENAASTEYKNIKEAGLAEVIEGTGNHKKYLVLHRDAPIGTIMRIRNEENDITIFARVVGKIPDTGDNGRLLVKVSKAAYDQLRAVNPRFRVEISY